MLRFRRLTFDDLSLMHRWLAEDPELNRIWMQGKQVSLEEITQKYGPRITGDEPTDPYLILDAATPVGYIQTYLWRDYPDYAAYVDLTDSASLDVFIGEESYRNRGLGQELLSRFLREFVFANPDVTNCIITPEVDNKRAIRTYEKVGFRHIATVPGIPGEPGPVYFMRVDREPFVGR